MSPLQVVILAIVQGLAELLPVSSSAHVVVAEKLLGLDPSAPPLTLLLVMLHTGTMFAVIVYFWRRWREAYFRSPAAFRTFLLQLMVATVVTVLMAEALIQWLEKFVWRDSPVADIETLFSRLDLIAPALAAAGVLIVLAGILERRRPASGRSVARSALTAGRAGVIGLVQAFCLPFRGFSRSGATISTGMLLGVAKAPAEDFSFALAVVLTPPVVWREAMRLVRAEHAANGADLRSVAALSAFGALVAFVAGLLALKWLSGWLEHGRWYLFGLYCLVAAGAVFVLQRLGY